MKILLIDDHALFREGLCHMLAALEAGVETLQAATFEQAEQYLKFHRDLDLVLLDLHMPGKDGFSALQVLTTQFPTMPVVIISASTLRQDIQRALDGGALGYIPKESTSSVMLSALRLVLDGGIYVPATMLDKPADTHVSSTLEEKLTPRQIQVLALLVHGQSNKEIARAMDLAEATVKMHVTAILKSLGVNNRTQAALAVEKLGLALSDH